MARRRLPLTKSSVGTRGRHTVAGLEDEQFPVLVADDGDVVRRVRAPDQDRYGMTLIDCGDHVSQRTADLALVGVVDELMAVCRTGGLGVAVHLVGHAHRASPDELRVEHVGLVVHSGLLGGEPALEFRQPRAFGEIVDTFGERERVERVGGGARHDQ